MAASNSRQHRGDLIVDSHRVQHGQVTGTAFVKSGAKLICHGQLAGGLIVEAGGYAVIHGQCCRDIQNDGELEVYGQVVGRILGNPPRNLLGPKQVIGDALPVPYRGSSESYSFTLPG